MLFVVTNLFVTFGGMNMEPYSYRRMTEEERAEVVRIRRERGYPLHSPPHPFRDAGYYLLTAANFEHQYIMSSETRRVRFEKMLLETLVEVDIEIVAWVVLPNHYHILVGLQTLDIISDVLKSVHGKTSRQWNLDDCAIGRQVWYRYTDRKMRDEKHYWTAINYIHYNPIKHGWSSCADDWLCSSFKNFFDTFGRDYLVDKWREYPIGNFGDNWDDD
jgi:putative transposase